MNSKATMLAVAIVMGCSRVEILGSAPSGQPPPPIEAEAAVRAFSGCDECTNGELQAVVKLGASTAPILARTLLNGPTKERLEAHRQFLLKRYAVLKESEKTHKNAVVPQSQDEFVQRYVEKYDSLQRKRSARALEAIGGADARLALEQSIKLPLRPDVLEAVKESLARIKG